MTPAALHKWQHANLTPFCGMDDQPGPNVGGPFPRQYSKPAGQQELPLSALL